MTRIWTLSDLHIDINTDLAIDDHPSVDIIVMAGDLCDGDFDPAPWILEHFSDEERAKMVFVSGNHEGYGIGIERIPMFTARLEAQTGVQVLDNRTTEISGRRIVGSPLWSAFDPRLDGAYGKRGDFAAIPGFTPDDWRSRHEECMAFLEKEMRENDIVVTHHAPAFEGLAVEMQQNPRLLSLSSGYYTNLKGMIAERQPALWVHGHTHITRCYKIARTEIASNALGRGRNPDFNIGQVVEIDDAELTPALAH